MSKISTFSCEEIVEIEVEKIKSSVPETPSGYIYHYDWQHDVWMMKDEQYGIFIIPTAGGKSIAIKSEVLYSIKRGKKAIVIVPTLMIVNDFLPDSTIICDRDKNIIGQWNPNTSHVLTDNESATSSRYIETIQNFLADDNMCEQDRVIVCCYASFIRAVEEMSDKYLNNCHIVVDECHHCQLDTDDNEELNGNKLGQAVARFMNNDSNKLSMYTATDFRTDQLRIFPEGIKSVKYKIHPTEILENEQINKYLSNVKLNLIIGKTYGDLIKNTWKSGHYTAIWITDGGSRSAFTKSPELKEIVSSIGTELTEKPDEISNEEWSEGNSIIKFIRTNDGCIEKLLDLVTIQNRDDRKNYLHKYRSTNRITVVVALKMFTEGYNWKPLDTIYIYGQRQLMNFIQIMGRGWREWPGKTVLNVNTLLCGEVLSNKGLKLANDYFNSIWAITMVVNYWRPIHKIMEKNGASKDIVDKLKKFDDEFDGNLDGKTKLLSEIDKKLYAYIETFKDNNNRSPTSEEIKEFVKNTITKSGYSEYIVDGVIAQLKYVALKRIKKSNYKIDYKMLEETNDYGVIRSFTSTVFDKQTLIDFKKNIISNGFIDKDTCIKILRENKITSPNIYNEARKKDPEKYNDCPAVPYIIYKCSYDEFWTEVRGETKMFVDKNECIKFMRENKITCNNILQEARRKNPEKYKHYPSNPNITYNKEFWNEVRGEAKIFVDHNECVKIFRDNGIISHNLYNEARKKDPEKYNNCPANPHIMYNIGSSHKFFAEVRNEKIKKLVNKKKCVNIFCNNHIISHRIYLKARKENPNKYKTCPFSPHTAYNCTCKEFWAEVRSMIAV